MAAPKTKRNDGDVDAFLASIPDDRRRHDAEVVRSLMAEVTGEPATMWGDSIVGFGSLRFAYADGRQSEWFLVGVSPRMQALTVYLMDGMDAHAELLSRLGPHTSGKSCLYIKSVAAIDLGVLRELVTRSVGASRSNESPEISQ
jgi:hypothetical protein